jgi:osmotically-inducible protein OsmY
MIRLVGLGALLAYFFDPQNGRSRREAARERLSARFRQSAAQAENAAQSVKAEAEEATDDVTLARKVETEIFRDADVPKGQINVNAENGKVVLRGEVEKPAMIKDLEERTRKVQGVVEVENLLKAPRRKAPASKTPAK